MAYAPPTPSNSAVGRRLGLTHSMICRIRMGNRFPSDRVMRLIEKEYGWPYIEQGLAIQNRTYAEEFERVLND